MLRVAKKMEPIDAIYRMPFWHKIWRPSNHLKSGLTEADIQRHATMRDDDDRLWRIGEPLQLRVIPQHTQNLHKLHASFRTGIVNKRPMKEKEKNN